MPANPTDSASLLEILSKLELLSQKQLKQFAGKNEVPKSMLGRLVQRGWLTQYQASLLLEGRGEELALSGYVLLEPLGEGGMGRVYKARHRLMQRVVAVKVIRPDLSRQSQSIERFRREIRLLAKMSHANIVAAHDAEQIGDRLILVMEYCRGNSLGELVRTQGRLSPASACEYVRQAAVGLQYAFEHGLIHRDIKPDNLLLSGQTVKVLDFGLARLHASSSGETAVTTLTAENTVIGTPDFVAPEQALDLRRADTRSDIYSLGCTLYYLVSGQVPFPGGTVQEKLLRHQMETPPSLGQLRPDIDKKVSDTVEIMMHKDPDLRYQTPGQLAEALPVLPYEEAVPSIPNAPAAESSEPTVDWETGELPSFQQPVKVPSALEKTLTERRRPIRLVVALALCIAAVSGAIFTYSVWNNVNGTRKSANNTKKTVNSTEKNVNTQPGQNASSPTAPWELLKILKPNCNRINSVAFSLDSTHLAAACGPLPEDSNKAGGVGIWEVSSGKMLRLLGKGAKPGYLHVAFAPKQKRMLVATGAGYWTWDTPGQVQLWDALTGERLASLGSHDKGVSSVVFSPDGQTMVTVGRFQDTTIRFWDVATVLKENAKSPHMVLTESSEAFQTELSMDLGGAMFTASAFSPGGTKLAVATDDQVVHIWSQTGSDKWEGHDQFRVPDCPLLYQASFSPNGDLLAVSGGKHDLPFPINSQAAIWNLAVPTQKRVVLAHPTDVWSMAFTPGGRHLLTGDRDGWLRLWNVEKGTEVHKQQVHDGWTYVTLAPDGKTIATGGEADRLVKLWRFHPTK